MSHKKKSDGLALLIAFTKVDSKYVTCPTDMEKVLIAFEYPHNAPCQYYITFIKRLVLVTRSMLVSMSMALQPYFSCKKLLCSR